MRRWKVAGVNFDHFHMGDLLRMAVEHPQVDLVGVYDEDPVRVAPILQCLHQEPSLLFESCEQLIQEQQPDLVILCPAAAKHAEWFHRVARPGQMVLIEKPFAGSLDEAKEMIEISQQRSCPFAINWPLAWYRTHRTAYRLAVDEQRIGELIGVQYFGGNRGPLWHTFDKIEVSAEEVARNKPKSWFYQRSQGGGSLLDYLGYGATLGSWFLEGREPIDVTSVVDRPVGLEVDEHSITVCRYSFGLSRLETRWGTFTDPWTYPTIPPTGFTLLGTEGCIQSSDYAESIRVQDKDHPAGVDLPLDRLVLDDPKATPWQRSSNPIEY